MRTLSITLLLAGSLAPGADQPQRDAPRTDKQILQGTWVVVSGEANGKPAPEEAINGVRWVIREDHITSLGGGGNRFKLTFHLDSTQTPRAIDLINRQRKETVQGIYQLGKDTWKLCIGAPGENRPKSFATKNQAKVVVFIFRRSKS